MEPLKRKKDLKILNLNLVKTKKKVQNQATLKLLIKKTRKI